MKSKLLFFLIAIFPVLSFAQENGITFQVCEVEENNTRIDDNLYFQAIKHRISYDSTKIESFEVRNSNKKMIKCKSHAFIEALYYSFAYQLLPLEQQPCPLPAHFVEKLLNDSGRIYGRQQCTGSVLHQS